MLRVTKAIFTSLIETGTKYFLSIYLGFRGPSDKTYVQRGRLRKYGNSRVQMRAALPAILLGVFRSMLTETLSL